MARSQQRLQLTKNPDEDAWIFRSEIDGDPFANLRRVADNDILCGECGAVLAHGQTLATLSATFPSFRKQTLIECPVCSALNLLPRSDEAELRSAPESADSVDR